MEDEALKGDDLAKALSAYEVLGQRRVNYDQMGWQTPALSFTAQAFLFSVALSPDATRFGRVLSALLALVISGASIQLMRKHLHLELIDALILERLEDRLLVHENLGLGNPPHSRAERRRSDLKLQSGSPVRPGPFDQWHSPTVWTLALGLFGIAALAIVVTEFIRPEVLG